MIKRIKQMLQALKSLYINTRIEDFASSGINCILEQPCKVNNPKNIFIGNDVAIRGMFTFISHTGKLIIKDHVGISQYFTVVTGNHTIKPALDMWQVDCNHSGKGDIELDTIIEEDVWIGIHVTVMPGVTIGRGSIIGAGSLVTKNIPPYCIAVGVPCRVIKAKYSIEEIIQREKILYKEDKRLTIEQLNSFGIY